MKQFPPLATTAIGSVPFHNVETTLDLIAESCPDIPHWPQMVKRHPREDMVLQAVDGLPGLVVDEKGRKVEVMAEGREQALTTFYERFFESDLDYFKIPDISQVGFSAMLKRAEKNHEFGKDFLKAQMSGPVTLDQSIRTPEGKSLLSDPDLADAVVKGIGKKAAWLAQQIGKTGRQPLIFFDEPGLTGFGSAFTTLARGKVIEMFNEIAAIVRETGDVRLGVHVCGNTDWGMLTETDLDVINFDAFEYLDHFLLYPEGIKQFIGRGGYIAWGIVPTLQYHGTETPRQLANKLESGFDLLATKGIQRKLIIERAIITPACGVGSVSEDSARAIYGLLPKVADLLRP